MHKCTLMDTFWRGLFFFFHITFIVFTDKSSSLYLYRAVTLMLGYFPQSLLHLIILLFLKILKLKCLWVHLCGVCIHVCMCMEARGEDLLSCPIPLCFLPRNQFSHWTWNCTSGQQAPEILMSVFHSARVVGIWPHLALGFELRPTCLHGKITLSYLCSSHLNFWDRISSLNLELAISAWLTGKGTSRFHLFLHSISPMGLHMCAAVPNFYIRAGDSNWELPACITLSQFSSLPPQLSIHSFLNRISCGLGWPETCFVVNGNLELLFLLPYPVQYQALSPGLCAC